MVQGLGSNEIIYFWNDKDGGCGGFSASSAEEFQNPVLNPEYDAFSGSQSSDCKRIRLFNQQEGDANSSEEKSLLGLTLSKTPSFLNLVEMKLSQAMSPSSSSEKHQPSVRDGSRAKMDDFMSQPMSEKLKASNFPALFLKIGSWERFTRHEGDLVAKCYYAKRKIVWEVLEGALKSKIEVQWSDIEAIRAIIRDDEPGILEIELNQPPLFFRETNPQPRKHTLWQQASDFTGGQAPICRRHYVKFPPGTLDKHYEKLLQCDHRLLQLSQRPFPRLESPYFYPNIYGVEDISFDFIACQSQAPPGQQYPFSTVTTSSVPPHPVHNFKLSTGKPFVIVDSDSPMSVMDFPRREENISDYAFDNQRMVRWGQEGNNFENILAREDYIQGLAPSVAAPTQAKAAFSCQGYPLLAYGAAAGGPNPNIGILRVIENHLLGDSQYVYSDERKLLARMKPMSPLVESFEEANPQNNIGMNHLEYKQENFNDDDDHSIFGTTERSEVDGGLLYPQPIGWLPPQIADENLMMHLPRDNSSYPYEFSPLNG